MKYRLIEVEGDNDENEVNERWQRKRAREKNKKGELVWWRKGERDRGRERGKYKKRENKKEEKVKR